MFFAVKLLIRGNQAYKYIVGRLLVSFWLVDLIKQRIKARKIAWGQLESWVTRSVLLSQSVRDSPKNVKMDETRLKQGEVFSSFKEFEYVLKRHCQCSGSVL